MKLKFVDRTLVGMIVLVCLFVGQAIVVVPAFRSGVIFVVGLVLVVYLLGWLAETGLRLWKSRTKEK